MSSPAPEPGGPVWHTLGAGQVLQAQQVDGQRGLCAAEVASRAQRFGLNKFAEGKTESRWRAFARQYADPMQIVLLVAGIVSLYPVKELETGLVLIFLTLFNAVLGLRQEGKAAAAVAALQKMMIVKAKVTRDGGLEQIPAEQLVPGDVVSIEAGDIVPADGRLLRAARSSRRPASTSGNGSSARPSRCRSSLPPRSGRRSAGEGPPRSFRPSLRCPRRRRPPPDHGRIASLMGRVRPELAELVAIRSVADRRQFPQEECARAAQWVLDAFAGVGFADARLAEMADGSQAVLGSRRCPDPAAATVLLYAHYDVPPPLNEAEWRTPPFELTEVDGRWYGRGTADCKGNIFVHLTALRALGDEVPVNLRLVVEGSEETTGALEGFVPGHADLLRADAILVGDAGNAAVGHPAVTVSLRGVADVIVHVKALASELHSGLFGGPAPDTLAALARRYPRHRPVDAAGNHPRKGDDDPRPLGTESESHLELKERCTGHSFWVYWAPFFLASGAPLLGIPV